MKETCAKCNEKTSDAHYKFVKVRDALRNDTNVVKMD